MLLNPVNTLCVKLGEGNAGPAAAHGGDKKAIEKCSKVKLMQLTDWLTALMDPIGSQCPALVTNLRAAATLLNECRFNISLRVCGS